MPGGENQAHVERECTRVRLTAGIGLKVPLRPGVSKASMMADSQMLRLCRGMMSSIRTHCTLQAPRALAQMVSAGVRRDGGGGACGKLRAWLLEDELVFAISAPRAATGIIGGPCARIGALPMGGARE